MHSSEEEADEDESPSLPVDSGSILTDVLTIGWFAEQLDDTMDEDER